MVPTAYPTTACSYCGKPIVWAFTKEKMARMPVDPIRVPVQAGKLVVPNVRLEGPLAKPLVVVLNKAQAQEAFDAGDTELTTSHFATCTRAAEARAAAKARRGGRQQAAHRPRHR